MESVRKINKVEFKKLDLDTKCIILEELLTDDYFEGQKEINFWLPEDFDSSKSKLPEKPIEIKEEEKKKFNSLIKELTEKLFKESDVIEIEL